MDLVISILIPSASGMKESSLTVSETDKELMCSKMEICKLIHYFFGKQDYDDLLC